MSNTNYDVEIPLTYSDTYRHYIPSYRANIAAYRKFNNYGGEVFLYDYYISFDEGSETELGYSANVSYIWNDDPRTSTYNYGFSNQASNKIINESGIYSKVYIRNKFRDYLVFDRGNCYVQPVYSAKAAFEVQWNSTGFAANTNASFRCSTIQKNTYKQYEWVSATVYYKASTDQNYSTIAGTVSGSWSDVTISTSLSLTDGVTYDIYIVATADDGTTAATPVAQFTTTDTTAIATCISPSGAFISGDVTFIWSHATEYGTPQYAYDLQYSINNGSSWTTLASHIVTPNTTASTTLTNAGVYLWRVRTYNSNDVAGEWAEATFVNQVPANPPTNLQVSTKGRPTVEWASVSQSAYQIQFLLGDSVVYDSGAVYTSETSHFVNKYFDDNRSYTVRLRIYNALGETSEWVETGYQQPNVTDVEFEVKAAEGGGVSIAITPNVAFSKYFILRNDKPIALVEGESYTDIFAVGLTNYGVVGVDSGDQSDIQTQGIRVTYPHATIIALNGQQFSVNKRMNEAYQIQTSNQADINKASFIGEDYPTHYPSKMRLKSFSVNCFDDQNMTEELLGQMVFYADNFGNGGWCMVTSFSKTDDFIKTSRGVYGNEVSLTLEVTKYDDSIEYPL